jgi:hypothetical protein
MLNVLMLTVLMLTVLMLTVHELLVRRKSAGLLGPYAMDRRGGTGASKREGPAADVLAVVLSWKGFGEHVGVFAQDLCRLDVFPARFDHRKAAAFVLAFALVLAYRAAVIVVLRGI